MLFQMYDTLVGTATEWEFSRAKFHYKRAINQDIKVWKYLVQSLIRLNLLILEAGIAPDGLVGFLLYSAGKLSEGLNLEKRISSGESDIGEFILLDNIKQGLYRHLITSVEVPGLGIMAAGTMMCTARAINGSAQTRTICHGLVSYV